MERKITYRDSYGVRRTSIWDDANPGEIHTFTEQDMSGVIDNNHEMRELHPRRSMNKLVARGVPITVAEKAMREDWDEKDWAKWLNDPDNAAFRVWRGRV